jgi:hypothetical protein
MLTAHGLGPITVLARTRNARTQHPASIALTLIGGKT